MKTLLCVKPFGYHEPGDEIQIPDDAVFDNAYFAVKADASSSGGEAGSSRSADSAKPSYPGYASLKENKE